MRAAFLHAGISLAEWSRTHGFNRMTVVNVLHGRCAGHYGEAHRVAVALGLKDGEIVDAADFSAPPVKTSTSAKRPAARKPAHA